MSASPKNGAISYKASNTGADAQKARAASMGNAARIDPSTQTDDLDLQDVQGNSFVNGLLKGEDTEKDPTSSLMQASMPSDLRWKLLSSNDLQTLAGLIYSEATPSATVTQEMMAIGSTYYNRSVHASQHPDDQKEFGGATMQDIAFQVQRNAPTYYDGARYQGFHYAAAFDAKLASEADVKAAEAAVDAASQIMNGLNPFPDTYMYLDAAGQCPNPERADMNSHAQYGRFHFWALNAKAGLKDEKKTTTTSAPLATSSAAEPVI